MRGPQTIPIVWGADVGGTLFSKKGSPPTTSSILALFLEFVAAGGAFAEFPDDALSAELAVSAGVGAGFAVIQAFLAVADAHFGALHPGLAVGVVTALHVYSPWRAGPGRPWAG